MVMFFRVCWWWCTVKNEVFCCSAVSCRPYNTLARACACVCVAPDCEPQLGHPLNCLQTFTLLQPYPSTQIVEDLRDKREAAEHVAQKAAERARRNGDAPPAKQRLLTAEQALLLMCCAFILLVFDVLAQRPQVIYHTLMCNTPGRWFGGRW